MLRNIKVLGLALVAVLAMSALAASVASASVEATEFTSTAAETALVAGQVGVHEFVTNTGVVVCEVAHFTGEGKSKAEPTQTIAPAYSECEFEGLFNVTVSVNGCKYKFNVNQVVEGESVVNKGSVAITGCNESVPYIQVGSLATCRVRVGEQTVGSSTFEVVGSNLKVTAETTGIEYTDSGLFCVEEDEEGNPLPVNNGTYNGISVAVGNGEAASLSVD